MTQFAVDKRNPMPLYFQLQELIIERIEEGAFAPGDPLPSEQTLIEESGLSRTTVRQAIENLVNQGVLEKRRGVGTFVCEQHAENFWDLNSIRSFREMATLEGKTCTTRQLSLDRVEHDERATKVFGNEAGTLWRMRRLRSIDGRPSIFSTTFVPARIAPELDRFDFSERSLFDVMGSSYGIDLDHAEKTFMAQAARVEDALLLGIEEGSPIQHVETITYNKQGEPVEFSISRDRGDVSRYKVVVHRREKTSL